MKISSSSLFTALVTVSSVLVPSTAAPLPATLEDCSKIVSKVSLMMTKTAMSVPDGCSLFASVPLGSGGENLPGPSGRLRAVVMGFGTQNYKCTAEGAAPIPYGADAALFDTRCMANSPGGIYALRNIARVYLDSPIKGKQTAPSVLQNFSIGHHFFIDGKIPVFELNGSKQGKFVGKKLGNVPAPTSAYPGENGAVDWLKLGRAYDTTAPEAKFNSDSYTQVYRVHTAGGKAPKTCPSSPGNVRAGESYIITVPYATQYWLLN